MGPAALTMPERSVEMHVFKEFVTYVLVGLYVFFVLPWLFGLA